MTKEERRVKHYVDAWCEGKRVQWSIDERWLEVDSLVGLMGVLEDDVRKRFYKSSTYSLRIVKGKRV